MNLKRLGDTCWNSHYSTLVSVIHIFFFLAIDAIEDIVEYGLKFWTESISKYTNFVAPNFWICFQFTIDEKCFGGCIWVISSITTKIPRYSECNEVGWTFKVVFYSYERRCVKLLIWRSLCILCQK
jgi:hypothetical protein